MEMITNEIARYENGNCNVILYADGTKVRFTGEDEFIPEFPESIDLMITTKCRNNCPFCYMEASCNGKHANLRHPLLESLHAGTELAIGGGNPLEHPDLIPFLMRMKLQGVVCNMTVNWIDFDKCNELLHWLSDEKLIHGLGISIPNGLNKDDFCRITSFPHSVAHTIAGIVSIETLQQLAETNITTLILGYKHKGRGVGYFDLSIHNKIEELRELLSELRSQFSVLSFDNLALEQLDIQSMVSPREWKCNYMGNDGQFTMYIDLVKETYAASSLIEGKPIDSNQIEELFHKV